MSEPRPLFTKHGDEVADKATLKVHDAFHDINEAEKRASSMKLRGRVNGLCGRCSNSAIIVRSRLNDPIVLCCAWKIVGERSQQVPLDIVSCTSYQQEGTISVEQLIQISKTVDLGEENKKAGFLVDHDGKKVL